MLCKGFVKTYRQYKGPRSQIGMIKSGIIKNLKISDEVTTTTMQTMTNEDLVLSVDGKCVLNNETHEVGEEFYDGCEQV